MNWKGLQVLLTFDLADRLGVSRQHLLRNFARHRHMLTEGVHYFVLSGMALNEWKGKYGDSSIRLFVSFGRKAAPIT